MDDELRTKVAGVFRTWRPDIDSVYDMADDILALVAKERAAIANNIKGMTLRQWYAGLAMNGWMVHYRDARPEDIATFAYEVADSMIAKGDTP